MRILIVTTRYGEGLGGKENYLVALAAALEAAGHTVRVATRADDAFREFAGGERFTAGRTQLAHAHAADVHLLATSAAARAWALPAYRAHFYALTFPLAALCFARALAPALAPHVAWADVVHYDGTGRELLGHATLRQCEKHGKALVICPHLHVGSWGDGAPDLALYARASGLIAKTEVEAAVLGGGPRVAVIGNGPYLPVKGDADALAARLGGRGPTLLFVGRRTASKGWPLVLAALPEVLAAHPDARLVALSPRDDGAPTGHPQPHVHVLAGASEADKDAAYQLATVVVLPSAAEAFGMAVVEGWSHGVPAVVSDIPTLTEVVTRAGGGRVVPRDPRALAAALNALLGDPGAARALGEAGRAEVDAHYRWDTIAARTVDLYTAARERAL